MKSNIKSLVAGLVAGVVIAGSSVFAITNTIQKSLIYNNIKITLDGEEITPKDANGNQLEPFIIEGTTYLPVRAVADAVGLDVGWDEKNFTVMLSHKNQNAEGVVIYDKNDIKITYLGRIPDEETTWSTYNIPYKLLIENNSKKAIRGMLNGFSVNGFMVSSEVLLNVEACKKSIEIMKISKEDLAKNGITKIENIEFGVNIQDNSGSVWDSETKVTINNL